ncbi:MAG: di-heme enzyme [Pseudobacteriovorax sp.]|nr:di-heme enzyme [Pseudobacteriovorax sp.]
MLIKFVIAVIVVLSLGLGGCLEKSETRVDGASTGGDGFAWGLTESIPFPQVPEDNPMSEEKFQLGRHLFYDVRLSGNGTQSCASCHQQSLAFSDGLALAIGSTGEVHPRNSQPLVNIAYNSSLTWANSSLRHLEQQILIPLFGENPVEQGLNDDNIEEVLQILRNDSEYSSLFLAAFPDAQTLFTVEQIVDALSIFVRGLISFNSPYDRFLAGETDAISASAIRGRDLFFSERLECFHCHGGYNFSDSTFDETMAFIEMPFHNTGLFNIDGKGSYPSDNRGLMDVTNNADDMGRFRAVTLRNIEVTAPYMHDGTMASLEEVLEFYSAGGRNVTSGPNSGDGRASPLKSGFVTGFDISDAEKQDVLSFLRSLTDNEFLQNPRFANPWE